MKSRNRKNRKKLQQYIGVFLMFALVFHMVFGSWIPGTSKNSDVQIVRAEEEDPVPDYTPTTTSFTPGSVSFDTREKMIDYCYLYRTNESFARDHQNDAIEIPLTNDSGRELNSNFVGFGSKKYPFNGTIRFAGNDYMEFSLQRAFFSYVNDNVKLMGNNGNLNITLKLTRSADVGSDKSAPVLADHVEHNTGSSSTWHVEAVNSSNSFSGLIGTIHENAVVSVSFTNSSAAAMVSNADSNNADIGAICGKMETGSQLTVASYSGTASPSITSSKGNAGALVGTMEGTATLTVTSLPTNYAPAVAANTGYAGGIVGGLTSDATITLPSSAAVKGTITGKAGAGGLFGHYVNKKTTESFDISTYYNGISATATGTYAGGLFGVFENESSETAYNITFSGSNTTDAHKSGNNSNYDTKGHFGGLIGCYKTGKLTDTLTLSNLTMKSEAARSFASYGGVIGIVDSAAYIKADNVSVTAKGTDKRSTTGAYFGGLIGKTSATAGVFVDLGDFTLSTGESFRGGGVVGVFNNGVLRLSGTTNMSSAKTYGTYSTSSDTAAIESCYGQLVGENDNVLVYALGGGADSNPASFATLPASGSMPEETVGWKFIRSDSSVADDLGTWGEVVRLVNDGSGNKNLEDAGIVTFDSSSHTITLDEAVPTNMSNTAEFARTALNIMLNQGESYGDLFTFDEDSARDTLLAASLSIGENISLSGTGINGFMRDGSETISASDTGSVGTFTGTFDGKNKTITFSTGESYGLNHEGTAVTAGDEGTGLIYRHQYNGLFAVVGNGTTGTGTIKDLTLSGNINIHNAGANGMSAGGIAARSHGNTTIQGITANQAVNYYENRASSGASGSWGKYLGGLIGYVDNTTDNGTVKITGTTVLNTTFNFSGQLKDWMMCGGAIGGVSSKKVNIYFAKESTDTLTVTMDSVPVSGITADTATCIGGLIGYIHSAGSYADKKVVIDHTTFGTTGSSGDSCEIGNPATTYAGGIFGYSWYDTDVSVKGVTVANCTLNYAAGNVGVFAYDSTGRWTVDSLAVSGLTLSGGAGTTLGMLVNKMYTTDSSSNVNGALYLDLLNSGYTLTGSGITLPTSIGTYDEVAVYSAPDVVKGGAGVISINMSSSGRTGTDAKVTTTGTYQNKLSTSSSSALSTSKYPNANARYYYNLDLMKTTDAGQNLTLWSVNKYIYSGIAGAIPTTTLKDNNLTGTANLEGLSYYPLAKAGDYTLNNLNVTFDYDGIHSAEANNTFNSDSYNRDPGATGTNRNQHYLMHAGLFIDLPAGKTITISGSSSIGGTFLEVGNYKAALISGTMNGNLNISGTLDLNGLIPKTTGSNLYNAGYLLVNAISRPDEQTPTVSINIRGLTASGYSTATLPVAKSLFGAANGRGFMFDFSGIKLDGRKANVSDTSINDALNKTYGTSKSIFSNAILFDSIYTDLNAEMTYNFTYDDDWGIGTDANAKRNVTYGNEISHTVEYWDTEKNKSRQSKYSGTQKSYTNPTGADSEYDFLTTVFLPYVGEPYNSTADHSVKYYREIKVNYLLEIESKGCGTYNDPYIIESSEQLVAIAAFIKSGNTTSINLSSIILPKYDATKFHGVAANSTGARWCTDKKEEGSDYHIEYSAKDGGGFYATDCTDWPDNDARYYLASAYYKIGKSITLGNDFVGLGGTEANYAFRGVIVGEVDAQGAPKYTITNKSQYPFIYVSNGSVVKDVNVVVNFTSGIQLQQDNYSSTSAYFGYDYSSADTCIFYGGIIGEIMGGDNIIDNSYVTYSTTDIVLKGDNGTIVPVGGYVGVIVYGGLIFKNMDARKTPISATGLTVKYIGETYNLADNRNDEAWAAIYVNPLVGRVINGYAVNETGGNAKNEEGNPVQQFSTSEDSQYHDDLSTPRTGATEHTLKNGKKHYTIADINRSEENKLDVVKVPGATNGKINVPNAQALFVLSLITQSGAGTATDASLGAYASTISYGIDSTSGYVCGMSHDADYTDVGTDVNLIVDNPATDDVDETNVTDYQKLACNDTANNENGNAPVPYIIRHYTKIEEGVSEYEDKGWTISFDDKGTTKYLKLTVTSGTHNLRIDNNPYYFDSITKNSGFWKIQGTVGDVTSYIQGKWASGFAGTSNGSDAGAKIDLYDSDGTLYLLDNIDGKSFYISNVRRQGEDGSGNARVYLKGEHSGNRWLKSVNSCANATLLTFKHIYVESGEAITRIPARCITSTAGYYDIELTGKTVYGTVTPSAVAGEDPIVTPLEDYTYLLPDSFRGLGCVGIYDASPTVASKYGMKIDTFEGNGCTIDQDIYLNKYENDNYFNVLHAGVSQSLGSDSTEYVGNKTGGTNDNHGIGLFDSVITKNSSSKIGDFILSGSVNTEIYSNDYSDSDRELSLITTGHKDKSLWLSVGGVCGWSGNGINLSFNKIQLNNLTVNGADFVGGLLGFSGTSSNDVLVTIRECSATNISIIMSSANVINQENAIANSERARNGMGCFVGKVLEGGVRIYGTASTTENILNDDLTKFSTVTIKDFGFADDSIEYYTTAGGLVGFAGNGCKVYDMKVIPAEGKAITIGNDKTRYAGGLVGLMQPKDTGGTTCIAEFYNCTVQEINVKGHYAGGFYGGKWINNWSPYSIKIDKCKVVGNNRSNNTITGNDMADNGYAGGFLGCGNVYEDGNPNIEISDSKVLNYTITSNATTAYVGGFIGYTGAQKADKSITCYIHDSSVEDCIIGTGSNYGGGAIGRVVRQSGKSKNRILGYNIMLEDTTIGSTYKGAWIGHVNSNDSTTSIQFAGVGIYGNGFEQNVGNRENFSNASFVFADYNGSCNGTTVTADAGEEDVDSDQWNDSGDGTITHIITTVTGGNKTTKTLSYNYISAPTEEATTEADGWTLDETNGIITCISSGRKYSYTIAVSGLNKGTVVDMPKYPYVNINPQSHLGSDVIISGDGAVLNDSVVSDFSGFTAQKTLAAKIYSEKDTSGTARQYYTTFVDTAIKGTDKIDAYMSRGLEQDGDRISTYYTEKKESVLPDGVDDFAVVVIANNETGETTELINRYIQLVTNTTTDTDYSKTNTYFNVDIKTCKFDSVNNKFVIDTSLAPGLGNDKDAGTFYLIGANADSRRDNTFTLLDVQFKDPLHTNKIAYHLYVPVYTIKQIEVEFYSAADNGTYSVKCDTATDVVTSSYDDIIEDSTKTIHFDGLKTWVTQYVRFKYSQEDLTGLINSGNLKWNHSKSVIFETTNGDTNYRVPDNTYMILVDPNGGSDKEYYVDDMTVFDSYTHESDHDGWIIDFTKFENNNTSFSVQTFADMLAPVLTVVPNVSDGNYTTVGADSSNYQAYSYDSNGDKVYYLLASEGDGDTRLSISADYNEDYYISMYVPYNADYGDKLYWYKIRVNNTLEKPDLPGASTAHMTEMKNFDVFVADLYEQTTTNMLVVEPETEQISSTDRRIVVTAKTEISIRNRDAVMHLKAVEPELYHSFNLSLTRYYSDGNTLTSIIGLDPKDGDTETRISAKYRIGGDVADDSADCADIGLNGTEGYLNVKTSDTSVMSQLLANHELGQPLVISSKIVMLFDEDKLDDEFPLGTGNSSVGVNVGATSNLAYDGSQRSLAYTSMSKAFTPQDPHYYYRETVDSAHLYYSVSGDLDQYDIDGRMSENHSRLGVNGKKSDTPDGMEIITNATYNVSSINDYENADHIHLKFSLQQKHDTVSGGTVSAVEYRDVYLDDYLSGTVVFKSGTHTISRAITPDSDTSVIELDLPCEGCEMIDKGVFKFTITFNVKTSSDNITDYANYKVLLDAGLFKTSGTTDEEKYPNSGVGDYLVYTNAKIITEFITGN